MLATLISYRILTNIALKDHSVRTHWDLILIYLHDRDRDSDLKVCRVQPKPSNHEQLLDGNHEANNFFPGGCDLHQPHPHPPLHHQQHHQHHLYFMTLGKYWQSWHWQSSPFCWETQNIWRYITEFLRYRCYSIWERKRHYLQWLLKNLVNI